MSRIMEEQGVSVVAQQISIAVAKLGQAPDVTISVTAQEAYVLLNVLLLTLVKSERALQGMDMVAAEVAMRLQEEVAPDGILADLANEAWEALLKQSDDVEHPAGFPLERRSVKTA